MKIINANTKQGQKYMEMYRNSNNYTLWNVYKTWSAKKSLAATWCKEVMNEEGGTGFKIISHNTFQFTAAWKIPGGIRVETRDNSYFIKEI